MMQFERMPPVSLLKGSKLKDVEARDYDWAFVFDSGVGVVAETIGGFSTRTGWSLPMRIMGTCLV